MLLTGCAIIAELIKKIALDQSVGHFTEISLLVEMHTNKGEWKIAAQ